jgi:acyl dehydratase
MNAPLPLGQRLRVRAQLMEVDDDGRRAVLRQRVVTGTAATPDAVVADIFAVVKLDVGPDAAAAASVGRSSRAVARVPEAARELAFWRLRPDAGLGFAMLTGDFNPIHWVRPYARAMGHRSTILHGFATLARTIEGLHRGLLSGATDRLSMVDVRFTRPLLLPARVGLYVDGRQVAVGDAPGGPAYLTGRFAVAGDSAGDFPGGDRE